MRTNLLFKTTLLAFFSLFSVYLYAQVHNITLPQNISFIEDNHFEQGTHVNPNGDTLSLNNFYLKSNSTPLLPVMGEFQYSRYPREEWENELLKMKASGVNVIGFYSFWIHHEQQEGTFKFNDNLDVKAFIQLIKKHNLQAVARIGPWVHGETRNGGYPDWFVKKYMKGAFDRAFDGEIKPEVKRWYAKLAEQFKGLYYKDGGPIIGVQLDNEVRSNGPDHWGYQYQAQLKELAVQLNIDVPLYVVTGWPGNNLPEDDVLPLWGGYPAAPWTGNSKPLPPNKLYTFVTDRRDKSIGNDIIDYKGLDANATPLYRHPFLTVEMGGGIQNTYHRRPIIEPKDLMGLINTRLGVGANMMGYYIYHGTQHSLSEDKSYGTQESKGSIFPYPNDYPIISYDFQSPLSEYGYVQPSYHYFKRIHQFLNAFGTDLAPMLPSIPEDNPKADDFNSLRCAVRSKGKSGFIFINNYVKNHPMAAKNQVAFQLTHQNTSVRIPHTGTISIPADDQLILPFNMPLQDVELSYALAQPLTKINNNTFVFYAIKGVAPQFVFQDENIKKVDALKGTTTKNKGKIVIDNLEAGRDCVIRITTKKGNALNIILLTEEESLQTYVFEKDEKQHLLITPHSAFYNQVERKLHLISEEVTTYPLYVYPEWDLQTPQISAKTSSGLFQTYNVNIKATPVDPITFKEVTDNKTWTAYVSSLDGKTPTRPTYGLTPNNAVSKTYSLKVPENLPKGVADVKYALNYKGNTAEIYADKLIIADDYYNGKNMIFSLKRYSNDVNKELSLQITPLMPERDIYFEPGTALDFSKGPYAELIDITATPIYEITVP